MIGSGLKKLAKEYGMTVSHGVAYGSLQGYAATMSEGSGYKRISFSGKVPDPNSLGTALGQVDLKGSFRIMEYRVSPTSITVRFQDNPGTMNLIRGFVDWFVPVLKQFNVGMLNVCPNCGCELGQGRWFMMSGIAYYMHDACKAKVVQDVQDADQEEKESRTGSYGIGAIGAFIGALLGAVVWAVVYSLGVIAGWIGLLIGWLAEKGYTLLKGKVGKPKAIILAVAVILGVVLGTYGGLIIDIIGLINDGLLPGLSVAEAPGFVLDLLELSSEARAGVARDLVMGLAFAAVFVYMIVKKASDEAAGTKVVDLQ